MRSYCPPLLQLVLLSVLVLSCKSSGKRFHLEGEIKNLNQGELYVYALDGNKEQTDTIQLEKGRFVYDGACEQRTTLMLVFPNFTEYPVFAEPGGKAKLKGDATNMKEMEISGNDDNEAMTAYRLQVAHAAPPDAKVLTEKFISDHASSPVATYLLRKHYIDTQHPNYTKASSLMAHLRKAQPHAADVAELDKQVKMLLAASVGKRLPAFKLTTIDGNTITEKDYQGPGKTVIIAYAEWSNEGMSMVRRLNQLLKDNKAQFRLLIISLDGNKEKVQRFKEQQELRGQMACPPEMFDAPAVQALSLTTVPDNIIVVNGKIVARSLPIERLENNLTPGQQQ